MARIRSIKHEFWTDEKVVESSPLARLLFIGLWNFADDEGRMVYSPTRIKLQILPADKCDIRALIDELQKHGMVMIYKANDCEYLAITNFSQHQKIDKRTSSRLPEPPRVTPNPSESPRIPTTDQGRDQGVEGIKEGSKEAPPDGGPVWTECLTVLTEQKISEKTARSFLGLLCREYEEPDIIAAVKASVGKADACAYVRGVLKTKPKRGARTGTTANPYNAGPGQAVM